MVLLRLLSLPFPSSPFLLLSLLSAEVVGLLCPGKLKGLVWDEAQLSPSPGDAVLLLRQWYKPTSVCVACMCVLDVRLDPWPFPGTLREAPGYSRKQEVRWLQNHV